MKFICPGVIKTGTKSIAQALRVLGYKVYDFDDQFLHFGDEFYDVYYRNKVPDFYRMFKDVDAVVDFPSYFFYEELVKAFPDAKVILSVRSDEDAWARSYKNQIEAIDSSFLTKLRFFFPTYKQLDLVFRKNLAAVFGTTDPGASYIYRKRYRWHNDRVKSVVPAEKLLVYSVEQGWEPLCEFTGKKIPNQPFPHLNVKGEIVNTFLNTELGRKVQGEVHFVKRWCLIIIVMIGAALLSYLMKYI